MAAIIIRNCNLISMDPLRKKIEKNVDILIEKGKISKIGKVSPKTAGKVINAEGKYVLPGMINCHTHIPMSLFREISDGHKLQEWLEKDIWPIEAKMKKEDFLSFSALSMVESLRNGVTLLNDMYFETDYILEAAKLTGIDLIETVTLMDVDGGVKGTERLKNFTEFCKKHPNVKKSVSIHGLYTASKKYIKECVKIGDMFSVNLYHIHFCENEQEVKTIKAKHGVKHPSEVLMECFQAGKHKLILAHCVKLDSVDFANLKKLNAGISHNPVSNLKLGCGTADVVKMRKVGLNVGIGTDGQGSCCNLSIMENAKFASLLQKGEKEDPTVLNSYEVLQMATLEGAKALGLDSSKGSISEGKDADVVIWDLDNIETNPINDICGDLVFNANSSNVDSVIVNGNLLISNKKNLKVNEKDLIKKCNKLSELIKKR